MWRMTDAQSESTAPVPRGRHAPPLEVRLDVQRRRLFDAAAAVFARLGYADASAEAISREAGMSKATFYEHFANKEECILALFDAAAEEVLRQTSTAAEDGGLDYAIRVRNGITAFLEVLAGHPDQANTLLVQIIGAGERGAQRRDAILGAFADYLFDENARRAGNSGVATFASRDDAFAVVGAVVELVSRHLRRGQPEELATLEPVIERVFLGTLAQSQA